MSSESAAIFAPGSSTSTSATGAGGGADRIQQKVRRGSASSDLYQAPGDYYGVVHHTSDTTGTAGNF